MSSEIVIREVTKGVWTFSKPFQRFGWLPFGGRSTAIQLANGGVWVLASTPLSPETKAKLDELGPVQYIVGADMVHYLFLGEYKKAYPQAKLIAPQAAIDRNPDKSLQYDGAWGKDAEGTQYGFESDIQHCYFSGFKNKDVAFFHPASKTVIEADLLFNLPGNEQYSKSKLSSRVPLFGKLDPNSWFHSKFTGTLIEDKAAMIKDTKTVLGWDFDRVIPCHGDVVETGGKKAWESVFRNFVEHKKTKPEPSASS